MFHFLTKRSTTMVCGMSRHIWLESYFYTCFCLKSNRTPRHSLEGKPDSSGSHAWGPQV